MTILFLKSKEDKAALQRLIASEREKQRIREIINPMCKSYPAWCKPTLEQRVAALEKAQSEIGRWS